MTTAPDPDSFLSYVSGVADAAETEAIEAWLSSGNPAAAAQYAEALAVYHAVALGLTPVEPPERVRQAVLGRVTADAGNRPTSFDGYGRTAPLRWPVYASTGLAACLAVALTASLWKNRELTGRADTLAANLTQLQTVQNQERPASAGLRQLMASPHLSMASLATARPGPTTPTASPASPDQPAGRVLFCPVTKLYQVTIFGLPPLPKGRAYELWLITGDNRPIPSGLFTQHGDGVATVMTHPDNVAVAMQAAVTDEPEAGSALPTGTVHLKGTLQPNR